MAWKEILYERPLNRQLDEPTRRAIDTEYRPGEDDDDFAVERLGDFAQPDAAGD